MVDIITTVKRYLKKNTKFSFIIILVIIAVIVKYHDNIYSLKESYSIAKAVAGSSPVQTAQLSKSDSSSDDLVDKAKEMIKVSTELADTSEKASKEAKSVGKKAVNLVVESNKIMDEAAKTSEKNIELERNISLSKSDTEDSMKEMVKESPKVPTPSIADSNPVDDTMSLGVLDSKYVPPPQPKIKESEVRDRLDIVSKRERNSLELRRSNRLSAALAKYQVKGKVGKWSEISKENIEFVTGPFSDIVGIQYNKYGYTYNEVKEKAKKALEDYVQSNPASLTIGNNKVIIPWKYTHNVFTRVNVWIATSPTNIRELNIATSDIGHWLYYDSY